MSSSSSTAPSHSFDVGVLIAVLLLYFVWGSTYLANAIALETLSPFPMLVIRFLLAGGILYTLLRLRGVPNPSLKEWRGSSLVGVLLLNGGLGMVVFAQQWVSSSLAATIVATMPLWLSLFGLFFGERTTIWEVIAMILGVAGVALISGERDLRLDPLALLVFVGPICWAFGSAYSRKVTQAKGLMSSAIQMLAAGSVFLVLVLIRGESLLELPSLRSGLALLFLVFFGSMIAYSAYIYLLEKRVRPALATSYAYVNPLVAIFLGVGLAGEFISPTGYWGIALILLAIILVVSAKTWVKQSNTR